jgi:ATP-dependent helicase/nuclease subunit A
VPALPARRRAMKPNAEQQAAIGARGEVFVSAGAGTGKTAVLVQRFVDHVCSEGLDVESVLVITYTRKAAAELRSRIRRALGEQGRHDLARRLDGAWISTIHGFCLRILKAHPFAAGLDPRFRELDEAQAAVLRSEAFDEAIAAFCADDDPARLRLLASYGTARLRSMLIGVYETLRAAGRALVLELGEPAPLGEAVAELREAALSLAGDDAATDLQRANSGALVALLDRDPHPDTLIDLAGFRCAGERAASYNEARKLVEQAALDRLAAADRALLQELLTAFAAAYAGAKERESALDFEDLQLAARDLLRDHADIRDRESMRFRSIMVDEFQDTNQLQCELVDLLASGSGVGSTEPPESGGVGLPAPGAGQIARELFFVGDEFQSIYGFRHADVEVFRQRRERTGGGLALTQNYRSRAEVLAAVNHLFAQDFGDDFQPLHASGDFTDPVFGHPVELLVTDKPSFEGTGEHWRRGEAKAIARRARELVDAGAATPGEIVLLFAAGTDAEWYEEELRRAGLPTYRATGRGYFGQQQVADLLAYLRLLHNRYDDQALVSVLASPFVGLSNDALVLIRRSASRRPLYAGIERQLPVHLSAHDERLIRAFKQRYERLVTASARLPLERLCEEIVAAHDYDLAVLAQWDGRRRYANLRKLARLARSYEELRGPDIEGFVRFVRQQELAGAKELEAVAEEEGANAVRLLTIHAAKGLEFKVVIVADAGRDRRAPSPDEILALSDGRFGFRVADPVSSKVRGAFAYDDVRRTREAEEKAERLRLYYVAMTRAIDRLIVSGAIDREQKADAATPMGWVLGRLGCDEEFERAAAEPVELERGDARLLLRVERFRPEAPAAEPEEATAAEPGQLALFDALPDGAARLAPTLPLLEPLPRPPLHDVRRLSFSAIALFDRCSYRYFAERVARMSERAVAAVPGRSGMAATEVGDAVHRLLELDAGVELNAGVELVRDWYPAVTEEELERIGAFVDSFRRSELAARIAELAAVTKEPHFTFEHDDVLVHGYLDVFHRDGPRALVVDYKTNSLAEGTPEEIVEADYRLQRIVYALACFRAGADEVEVAYAFLERPDAVVATTFARDEVAELEAELSEAIARIRAGRFAPSPSEFTCAGCPALDVVCAGPRLRDPTAHAVVAV